MKVAIDLDCTKEDIKNMIEACNAVMHRVSTIRHDTLMIDVKTILCAIEKGLPE